MKLKAIKVTQSGRTMYLASMTAKNILDEERVKVDIWDHRTREGYQREVMPVHAKGFANYLKRSGYSPLSILFNVRGKVRFSEERGGLGTLEIPEEEFLWVVDGQHRVRGIRMLLEQQPELEELEIPAIVINEENPYHEMLQFLVINRTQKGVKPDLAYETLVKMREEGEDIIGRLPAVVVRGIDWIPKATDVVQILNQDRDSPWFGLIRFANDTRGQGFLRQKTLTDSLKPVLTSDEFSDIQDPEHWATILKNYWKAIKMILPEAFESPEDYVVQSRTGAIILHRLFPAVTKYCRDADGRYVLKEEMFTKVLKQMPRMKSELWSKQGEIGMGGTSEAYYKRLLADLKEELEAINTKHGLKPARVVY